MARESMVTRTITSTRATVMGMNLVTAEPENKVIELPGEYKDNSTMLNRAKKVGETDEYKIVAIVASEVVKNLYAMSESDFITQAKIIPARKKIEK